VARQTGVFGNGLLENIQVICSAIGLAAPCEDAVDRARAPRPQMSERWVFPRDGAIGTLGELRSRGYPIGLISMCAPDTPALWRSSALAPLVDVTVFSCETGLRKPDPAIYRRCCDELEVEPSAVLYCGDGSYGELSGAERVGMAAVEIRDPAVDTAAQLRPEAEEWPGATVADLRDLLAWLPPR
jgi:putative hydrolase of the HAD superfamily